VLDSGLTWTSVDAEERTSEEAKDCSEAAAVERLARRLVGVWGRVTGD